MTDQIRLDNYLMILKSTVEVYVHGTLESSNEDVKTLLKHGLDETIKHQKDTYDIMTKKGWYTISNVEAKTIKQTIKTIESK